MNSWEAAIFKKVENVIVASRRGNYRKIKPIRPRTRNSIVTFKFLLNLYGNTENVFYLLNIVNFDYMQPFCVCFYEAI